MSSCYKWIGTDAYSNICFGDIRICCVVFIKPTRKLTLIKDYTGICFPHRPKQPLLKLTYGQRTGYVDVKPYNRPNAHLAS